MSFLFVSGVLINSLPRQNSQQNTQYCFVCCQQLLFVCFFTCSGSWRKKLKEADFFVKPAPLNSTVHVFIQSKLFFGRIEVEIGFHDGSVFLTLREIFGYYSKLKNYFC